MKKLFLGLIIASNIVFANVINSVAITINDQPITFYDIKILMDRQNISKDEAVTKLIDKIIFEQLVRNYNITADVLDIEDYVSKLAAQNSMDVYTFKTLVRKKYPNYEVFEEETKAIIQKQKLVKKIVAGQLKVATDEDLKLYYNNNKNKYTTASEIEAIQYASANRAALNQAIQNPMMIAANVQKKNIKLKPNALNPQLSYILNNINVNNFTPIIKAQNGFISFLVTKKIGTETQDFEKVKNKIFADVMGQREQKFLNEFFEKEKLTANIKIVK
ncbi:MAG: peptidylprolyl isomerase [Sulfurovum sp.]|jgi:hypothetical protein|nr:MAG: Uncharacterised protein [Arcobacter lacus]